MCAREFRRMAAAICLISFAVSPLMLHGQAPTSDVPTVTIRANTRLVLVDVVVTDKKGQPVTGLKAEDFAIEENGKKQRIARLSRRPALPKPLPSHCLPAFSLNSSEYVRPAGVITVLLLDAANSPFKDQAYGRLQMLKYVAEQSDSGMPMAVMTLTDRLHVLQEFTSDPKILTTAIKNLVPQERPQQPATPQGSASISSLVAAVNPVTGNSFGAEALISQAEAQLASFENMVTGYDLERRTEITIGAMRDLSRLLSGLPGRKHVVWLTSELPFDLIPQDRNISDAESAADLPSIKQKSVGTTSAGVYASESRQTHGDEIKLAESQFARANIAIYPVDMRGLISGMEATRSGSFSKDLNGTALGEVAGLQASQGTMKEVAAETGGKAYINQNEIKDGIALADGDEKASYTVGYYPDNKKWDGKYRAIKVKVNQGDIEIRYRKGYFAIEPGEAKDHNYNQDVAAALAINAPATQVSFRAQARPVGAGKIQVLFLVDAKTLSAEDSGGNKKMNVSFYAALYNSSRKELNLGGDEGGKIF